MSINTIEIEEKMLEHQGTMLRDRIGALHSQIDGHRLIGDGLAKETKSLAQEVDLYAKHLGQLILANHALRLRNSDLTAENTRLKFELEIARAGVGT